MTEEELRQLVAQGMSDVEIAARVNAHPRTVLRWRQRLGIASRWQPPKPPHGTKSRYGLPHKCRCVECKRANTIDQRFYRSAQQRVTKHAPRASTRWTEQEDAQIRAANGMSTTALARALGRSYDATRRRRQLLRDEVAP